MKIKKIVSGTLCVALLGAAGASFVSCDDREADIRTELKGEMGTLTGDLNKLREDLVTQQGDLEEILRQLRDHEQRLTDAEDKIATIEGMITQLQGMIDAIDQCKCDLTDYVTFGELSLYEKTSDLLKKLEGYVPTTEFNKLKENLEKNYYTKGDLYTQDEVNDLIRDFVDEDRLQDVLEDYVAIENLRDLMIPILKNEGYVTDKEVTAMIADAVAAVKESVKEVLLQMVTSIEINATVNPIFGGAALPADVRTTVLAAYHGVASQDVNFPEEAVQSLLKKAGMNITPYTRYATQSLFDEAEGNAGTLYLTINPSTVNYEDLKIALVTSKGDESPIELSPIKPSTEELRFGYTRAESQGFYEAKATLPEEKIDAARMEIDFNNLKNSVKDVINQRSKSSIAKLAANFFSESSNILPAYAVKATYYNTLDGVSTPVNVLSQYSLATTTVKPLSYGFMAGVQYDIPGIERIEKTIGDAIDNVFGQIKKALPDFSEIGEIGGINFDNVKKTIVVEITADQLKEGIDLPEYIEWEDEFGPHKAELKVEYGNITVEVPLDEFLGELESGMNLDQLNDALAQLKEISNVGSDLDDMRDELKNKVFSYIDRLNSAFNTLTGSVNAALQPCLLFADANGNLGRLTTSTLGTQVKGTSITLIPTSYTAELFAPAYKKFVAVTAVNGKSEDCAKYNNTEKLGKVISGNNWEQDENGNWKGIELQLEAGNKYEITYSALDYSGVISTKKYYITVK